MDTPFRLKSVFVSILVILYMDGYSFEYFVMKNTLSSMRMNFRLLLTTQASKASDSRSLRSVVIGI